MNAARAETGDEMRQTAARLLDDLRSGGVEARQFPSLLH
jgi:hypothetical protein